MSGPALLTDFYQLTMAYGYWKHGLAEREACFHHVFRTAPFGGGFATVCGTAPAAAWCDGLRFDGDDLAYLGSLGTFEDAFLDFLGARPFALAFDAVPEGTAVGPQAPLLRVRGPLYQCQLAESAILNLVNFQTLIATKAGRVADAAGDDPVLEFGLRRAQGPDGALSASRAAHVGGCAATSNVLAGRRFGIPVKGTHAHSWVLCFLDEETAFRAFAETLPRDCVLLVDTFDTRAGVRAAIRVARDHAVAGVRLDSGDLLALSRETRRMLDDAGLQAARIVASNGLDEDEIRRLKDAGAPIGVWGVGTRLVTGGGTAALDGVYKLSALRDADGAWQPRLKVSEEPAKTSLPGVVQVRRGPDGDTVFDERLGCDAPGEDLLRPVPAAPEPLAEIRERARAERARVPAGGYPVRLEPRLAALKEELARR